MLEIRKVTIAQLESAENFSALLSEYADELAINGLPHPSAKMETYKNLEKIGGIHPIAAFMDGILIGIINVLMVDNQHYGLSIAVSESYFVSKAHRKTGAGTMLRREAERCAESLGSPGLFINAPSNGPLAQILPCVGYEETGRNFLKIFGKKAKKSLTKSVIPAMSVKAINNVRHLEAISLDMCPQTEIPTQHSLHAGVYARTIKIPAGIVLTGALIKIATVLVLYGDALVYIGDDAPINFVGHHVLRASAGRKQAFIANKDTYLTMVFASDAKTVQQAEQQFTDEHEFLSSRRNGAKNDVVITGE